MKLRKIIYMLLGLIVLINSSLAQNYNSQIESSAGAIPTPEPLWNETFDGVLFQDKFRLGPCSFAGLNPSYGPSYYHFGSHLGVAKYLWGWGYDQVLQALNLQARDVFINQPYDIAQIRWLERRSKRWKYSDGTVYSNFYKPAWTLDLGVFFPNETLMDGAGNLSTYRYSRLKDQNWDFEVYDHPGLSEIDFWPSTSNYAEVGLYYANFIAQFQDTNGDVAPSINFHVKLLLRLDLTSNPPCASGFLGNSSFGTGHITIPDWANAPSGTQLP